MTGDATPALLATTIDCVDLDGMTRFWSMLLDVEAEIHEPFGFLRPSEGRKATIWLQRVPEERVGKNRLHLDFVVRDLGGACQRVVDLGGSLGSESSWESFHWRTCLDPEGNEFDIMQAQEPPPEA